jgi:RNA polymerase sigma-70 factor (ECF subfamily)
VDALSPEKLFDRRWAELLLERVLARLRGEYEAAGQTRRFEVCKGWLLGDDDGVSYAVAAAELGMEETGVRTLVHRLRRRFRELMRAAIAETVSTPGEVDDEIRALFHSLSG